MSPLSTKVTNETGKVLRPFRNGLCSITAAINSRDKLKTGSL